MEIWRDFCRPGVLLSVGLAGALSCTALIDKELSGKPGSSGGQAGAGASIGGAGGGQGASGGQGGTGGPTGCDSVTDCPTPSAPCEARVCLAGMCGTVLVPPGGLASQQTFGDCKVNVCDSSGTSIELNDDDDIPFDNSDCTEDTCNSGTPSNMPLPISTPCASNGGSVCDGAGSCVACNVASDCLSLPPNDECQTHTCVSGACGQSFTPMGTAIALQINGDCKLQICDGVGSVVPQNDDNDVPVDGITCTQDVCTNGVPSNPPQPAMFACGGGLCDGMGNCVGCISPTDCGTSSFCRTFSCTGSMCSVIDTPAGTPLPSQVPNNCKVDVCDGMGFVQTIADDLDLPLDDGNQCTDEVCVNGVPGHPNEPINTVCSQGGGSFCNGTGLCVQCNDPSQCSQGTPCQSRTCMSNSCGLANTPMGTPAPPSLQTTGDCKVVVCDGSGGTLTQADSSDPFVDNNECTDDLCMGTMPINPPVMAGTPCQNGQGICDGMGNCTAKSPNGSPCSTAAQCLSGWCVDGFCCNGPCQATCQACSAAKNGGVNGTCGLVPAGQDPDNECPEGACDGAGSCATCTHVWSLRAGDAADQRGKDAAVDGAGASLVVGELSGVMNLGGGNLTANGLDAFIVKYLASGSHLWSFRYGDAEDQRANGVAVDLLDNVVFTGELQGSASFGMIPLVSAGGRDVFVAKLNPAGIHLWSKKFGSSDDQHGASVAVDGAANVIVVGELKGTVSFDGPPLTSLGGTDVFVVKLDPAGNHVWSARFGGSGDDVPRDVAVDGAGNVLVTGDFDGAASFGGAMLVPAGGTDVFVFSLAANGNHNWSARFGDGDDQRATSIAARSASMVITGRFKSTIDFGGTLLSSPGGNQNIFLAAFGATGSHLWSRGFGDANDQAGHGVSVAAQSGDILLTGELQGTADFGLGPLTATGTGRDVVVVRFSSSGFALCNKRFGDASDQRGLGIAASAAGSFTFTGEMMGTADFGGGPRTSSGADDVFVTRFLP